MPTTRQNLHALIEEVKTMKPAEAGESTRSIVELIQIAQAFGLDPFDSIMPGSDAEADEMVDNLLALLLHVRGDDLPPFDLERHVRDATATDAA